MPLFMATPMTRQGVYARPSRIEHAMWPLVLYGVTAAIAVYGPDFNHFTWIAIAVLGVYAALACLRVEHHFFWIAVSLFAKVIFGVIIMSLMHCDVFEEAYAENGPLAYGAGNFLMHYVPMLIVVGKAEKRHVRCGSVRAFAQVWTALALFLCWMYQDKPMEVYGCRLAGELGVLGVFLVTIFMQLVVMHAHTD
jgi:hypothetical protein